MVAASLGHQIKWRGGQPLDRFVTETLHAENTQACEEGEDLVAWCPDPHWELHPAHKDAGSTVVRRANEEGYRVGTYSTSMNVPYLEELRHAESLEKRRVLDKCFPSQNTLWQYDHRYFLFEGRVEWNPPV
jgi:hypothetical protein